MAVTGVERGGLNAMRVAHLAEIAWHKMQCVNIPREDSSNTPNMIPSLFTTNQNYRERHIGLQWNVGSTNLMNGPALMLHLPQHFQREAACENLN